MLALLILVLGVIGLAQHYLGLAGGLRPLGDDRGRGQLRGFDVRVDALARVGDYTATVAVGSGGRSERTNANAVP
ncbi:hypothetical protein [Amycolatopsis sp. NPDC004625]|uniref:hypothetical protein n=1 Tax=Amycolatopsis sp. NPDC004625 TaxID=3154670 RepID=UPI0033AE1DC8